jgi:hypothetical protein
MSRKIGVWLRDRHPHRQPRRRPRLQLHDARRAGPTPPCDCRDGLWALDGPQADHRGPHRSLRRRAGDPHQRQPLAPQPSQHSAPDDIRVNDTPLEKIPQQYTERREYVSRGTDSRYELYPRYSRLA